MTGPTDNELRGAGAQLHVDRLRALFEAQLSDQSMALWRLAGVQSVAPHGDFTIHVNGNTHGPDGGLAVYVICACGRGYSWEREMPGPELLVWLANHGPGIPLDEEERRVKAAGAEEPHDVTEPTEARPYSPDELAKAITRQEHRLRTLELAVQLHVARARHGLTGRGDEALNQDVIDTAMRFDNYLRDGEEPTS